MGLDALLTKLERRSPVTPVTAGVTRNESAGPAPALGCTAVSAVTAENADGGNADEFVALGPLPQLLPVSADGGGGPFHAGMVAALGPSSEREISETSGSATTPPDSLLRRENRMAAAIETDERRYCGQCRNLSVHGLCLAARRGELVAMPTYEPILDLPQRCEAYLPDENDEDQRPGWVRWPGLVRTEKLREKLQDSGLRVSVSGAPEKNPAVGADAIG